MKSANSVMTIVMLAIFVTMVAVSSSYPEGARFMPFVIGIPGIVLCRSGWCSMVSIAAG